MTLLIMIALLVKLFYNITSYLNYPDKNVLPIASSDALSIRTS